MKKLGPFVALIALMTAAVAVPAHATQPSAQVLELTGQLTGPSTITGTWTGTGFVDDTGTYTETFRFAGETIHVEKVLVGSKGTIVFRVQTVVVWIDACTATFKAGSWQIVGGTGAYERLKGGGTPGTTSASWGNVCTGEIRVAHAGEVHQE